MTLAGAIASRYARSVETEKAKGDPDALRDVDDVRRNGMAAFVRLAWPQIEPGPMLDNWHVHAIAEHLEAVTVGQIRRLIVNVPPGCMKSRLISVLWNAWAWTEDPALRWIYASYDPRLSNRDAIAVRELVDSAWWRARWPTIEIPRSSSRAASDFANSAGGWRFSCGVEGKATGRHADIQVVDDPIKPQSLENAGGVEGAQLEAVLRWWSQTMATRLRDPKTARRVIVMQRLHERDLAGEMAREGGYEQLVLPMRFEPERRARTFVTLDGARELFFEDPRTDEGELLWPERYPLEEVDRIAKDLGPAGEAAQLQQRPDIAGGGIFKVDKIRRWRERPTGPTVKIFSIDARFKSDAKSGDHVTLGVWESNGIDHYLIDQARGRYSFTETIFHLLAMARKYPDAIAKLVENKANGPAIVNALEKRVSGLILVEPQGGKTARAHAVSALVEAGNVWIPEDEAAYPWVPGYLAELKAFPKSRFDDQVDQTTQALTYLHATGFADYARAMEALRNG